MKYALSIALALTTVVLIYFAISNDEKSQPSNSEGKTGQAIDTTQSQWEKQTDEQPPVIIAVTPLEFGKDFQTWKFQITFDTHSGSLDQDPLQTTVLTDDAGTTYKPVAWEGSGPGGHHREGILTFGAISPMPSFVELKIKNVGGILERSFRWIVNK